MSKIVLTDTEKVRRFAGRILGRHLEDFEEIDPWDVKDWALDAGLVEPYTVEALCEQGGCECEIGDQLYRSTPLGRACLDAAGFADVECPLARPAATS